MHGSHTGMLVFAYLQPFPFSPRPPDPGGPPAGRQAARAYLEGQEGNWETL